MKYNFKITPDATKNESGLTQMIMMGDSIRHNNGLTSQLIRFARVCNHVTDFNARNTCLTSKLLQQGNRYHKLRKAFSKFYGRHYELISKYNVGLKTLLCEGLSLYGDLITNLRKA